VIRYPLEILLAAAFLTVFGLVAAFAGAALWAGARGASPGAWLSAALYAPFALLALVLPMLAAPVARRALATLAPDAAVPVPWPPVPRFIALLAIAEALTLAARLAGGDAPVAALPIHAMLAVYTAVAAVLLGRNAANALEPPHADA
jgi:membrane protein implicated in regulation of membrane protease activity